MHAAVDMTNHQLCACQGLFEFYLRLNIAKSNDKKTALTAVDVAMSDEAEENMFGHWLTPCL